MPAGGADSLDTARNGIGAAALCILLIHGSVPVVENAVFFILLRRFGRRQILAVVIQHEVKRDGSPHGGRRFIHGGEIGQIFGHPRLIADLHGAINMVVARVDHFAFTGLRCRFLDRYIHLRRGAAALVAFDRQLDFQRPFGLVGRNSVFISKRHVRHLCDRLAADLQYGRRNRADIGRRIAFDRNRRPEVENCPLGRLRNRTGKMLFRRFERNRYLVRSFRTRVAFDRQCDLELTRSLILRKFIIISKRYRRNVAHDLAAYGQCHFRDFPCIDLRIALDRHLCRHIDLCTVGRCRNFARHMLISRGGGTSSPPLSSLQATAASNKTGSIHSFFIIIRKLSNKLTKRGAIQPRRPQK